MVRAARVNVVYEIAIEYVFVVTFLDFPLILYESSLFRFVLYSVGFRAVERNETNQPSASAPSLQCPSDSLQPRRSV